MSSIAIIHMCIILLQAVLHGDQDAYTLSQKYIVYTCDIAMLIKTAYIWVSFIQNCLKQTIMSTGNMDLIDAATYALP